MAVDGGNKATDEIRNNSFLTGDLEKLSTVFIAEDGGLISLGSLEPVFMHDSERN